MFAQPSGPTLSPEQAAQRSRTLLTSHPSSAWKVPRTLQIATDAFAGQHHAAETLVRLYHGLSRGSTARRSTKLVVAVAEVPNLTITTIDPARAQLVCDGGHDGFWRLVLTDQHATSGHGLSVRARNDRRITFATEAPLADGTVPLSSH